MDPKANKEAPVPPKTKARTKALKAKKEVLKDAHSHKKKKIHTSPNFQCPDTLRLWKESEHPQEEHPRRSKLTALPSQAPLTTEVAVMEFKDNSLLVSIVAVKASEHRIKQAEKKLYDIDMAKVNILSDPMKEAPDNKIGSV
ncbi:large ribosomal subunit protein uL23-like [Dasypus novemcinctus]|uniref:large ribosomal subunit protein uL23-like n=1 Tax=Dasypus novemcinctus TaxID=9361 RepID=UPI0003CC021D|nr:large ribosomal subunit protein uL23-like [Dasypus novemcinctus]